MDIALEGEINLPTLEAQLQDLRFDLSSGRAGTWGLPNPQPTLELDLGEVRFIELAALASLALICHGAVPPGGGIRIRVPESSDAASFLVNSNFLNVLSERHDGSHVDVELPGRWPQAPTGYDRLFPLQWVAPSANLQSWIRNVVAHDVGEDGTHLRHIEALQMADLILNELVENVGRHSGAQRALVGIMAPGRQTKTQSSEYMLTERPAFIASRAASRASLQLVVGDPGVGVARTLGSVNPRLNPEEVLALAFDRWSSSIDSSTRRGTRGLYHVAQLASSHGGYATLRSDSAMATEYAASLSGDRETPTASAPVFPGTLLRVDLPLSVGPRHADLTEGTTEPLLLQKLRSRSLGRRVELLDLTSRARRARSILLLDAGALPPDDDLHDLLLEIAEVCHPALAAVINLPCADSQLLTLTDSVNSTIEALPLHQRRTYRPILVVGATFDITYWAGMAPTVAKALQAQELLPSDLVASLPAQYRRVGADGVTRLRLSGPTLFNSAQAWLKSAVLENMIYPRAGEVFVTSSLIGVNGYIDIVRVLEEEATQTEVIARLATTQAERTFPSTEQQAPCILYEEGIPQSLATRTGELLRRNEPMAVFDVQQASKRDLELGRHLNLAAGSRVLILTRVAAEGETVRNLAAFVTRQNCQIHGLMSIVDASPGARQIWLWGDAYPTATIVPYSLVLDDPTRKAVFLSHDGSPESSQPSLNDPWTAEAIDMYAHAGAIHLGHFVGDQDRHFTFVISADDALSDSEARSTLMTKAASHAAEAGGAAPLERLCVGEDDWPGRPTMKFAKALSTHLGLPFPPQALSSLTTRPAGRSSSGSPLVFIVWTAITGKSIWELIRAVTARGATSLHVIVVNSQLSRESELSLLGMRRFSSGPFECQFTLSILCRIPFSAYSASDCPMCRQAAPDVQPTRRGLRAQIIREREFLTLRRWPGNSEIAAETFSTFFGGERHRENGAARLRGQLASIATTGSAWTIANHWRGHGGSELIRDLATLLMYEPGWLRRQPLNNQSVRGWLAHGLLDALVSGHDDREQDADRIRLLRALRLVSKVVFANDVSAIVRAIRSSSVLVEVFGVQVMELLQRDYLAGSGVVRRLAAGLEDSAAQARAAAVSLDTQDLLDELAKSARHEARRSLGRRATPVFVSVMELRSALGKVRRHDIRDAFRECLDELATVKELLGSWVLLLRWLTIDVQGPLSVLFEGLRQTNAFRGTGGIWDWASPQQPRAAVATVVEHLERLNVHSENVDSDFRVRMRDCMNYLARIYGHDSRQASLMDRAVDGLSTDLDAIAEDLAARALGSFVLVLPERAPSRVRVWVPDAILDRLLTEVCRNMAKYGDKDSRLSLEPSEENTQRHHTLTFRATGVAPRPRTGEGSPGGLREVQDMLAPRVGRLEHFSESPRTYCVKLITEEFWDE